jgi:hypothetical protein
VQFAPSFSPRAKVLSADANGHSVPLDRDKDATDLDQHVSVTVPITSDSTTLRIRFRSDFGIVYPYQPPLQGAVSSNLKIVSEQWNASRDQLTLQVAGVGGATYDIPITGDLTGLRTEGAELAGSPTSRVLKISFPQSPSDDFTTRAVALHFPGR